MAVTKLSFSKPPSTNNLFATNWKSKRRISSEHYLAWQQLAMQEIMIQPRHSHPDKVRVAYVVERGSSLADLGNREKAASDVLVKMGVIKDDSLIESIFLRWSDTVKGVRARITDCR